MNVSKKIKTNTAHESFKEYPSKLFPERTALPQSQEAKLNDTLWFHEKQVRPLLSPFWAWRPF